MKKLLVAAMAASLLAGCTSAGGSGTTPTGAPSSSPQPSGVAAPPVTDPLPSSVFDKHPCDSALTNDQLKRLLGAVPPARHTDNQAGPSCGWSRQETGDGIDVGWMTGVKGGLSQVYAASQTDAYHEPMDVDGYPALAYNPVSQPIKDCNLSVGINDELAFDVGYGATVSKLGTCNGAKLIAQEVLKSLRGMAGK